MRTIVIAALLLAGCGGSPDAVEGDNVALSPEALLPPTTPTSLAGVDFGKPVRAFGTEPYWALDITPGAIRFEDFAVKDGVAVDWAPRAPKIAGTSAVIETRTPTGEAVTILLTGESCLEVGDEASRLPLTARVKIGDRTLTGCAGERLSEPEASETDNKSL